MATEYPTSLSVSMNQQDDHESSEEELDSLCIPKKRTLLRDAHSGNSSTVDLSDLCRAVEACNLNPRASTPCVGGVSIGRQGDLSRPCTPNVSNAEDSCLSAIKDAIFTPAAHSLTSRTPSTPFTESTILFSNGKEKDQPITPIKRRSISYGAVVDTPPRSSDRFIPGRSRVDTSVGNYRTNKLLSELSSEQRQMRLDGAVSDPFMTRRVTPRCASRRNASGRGIPQPRAVSADSLWGLGGIPTYQNTMAGVDNGRGTVLESGTNARMFNSNFFNLETPQESHERFEGRLAMALDIDRSGRVLDFTCTSQIQTNAAAHKNTIWKDGQWTSQKWNGILDAPCLKNDFYCTLLAHCPAANVLAVGLKDRVYLWTESAGVRPQPRSSAETARCHVTSLSFSSPGAGKSILAIGRNDGRINLWGINETSDRIQHSIPAPVACLSFKPVSTRRLSAHTGATTSVEDLLVGDELGNVYYYSVEWPKIQDTAKETTMTLLAKLSLHSQQVCGLAWSPDGEYFASGGNDNFCYLLRVRDVLYPSKPPRMHRESFRNSGMSPYAPEFVPNRKMHHTLSLPHRGTPGVPEYGKKERIANGGPDRALHCWRHTAAVKAIAFCPWQKGLIATGGGSNDRAIHFFHINSGACLATINVYAQVTSLVWSKTRREICATFGYASPDHPYRIAVFSWPDCRQVVRIPWKDSLRALYAIAYPGGPMEENKTGKDKSARQARTKNSEGGVWWSRTREEGSIVIACSDQCLRFHEVWSGNSSGMGARPGGLAWSSILESEEGGDVEFGNAETIR